jgi:hypothetical protein
MPQRAYSLDGGVAGPYRSKKPALAAAAFVH